MIFTNSLWWPSNNGWLRFTPIDVVGGDVSLTKPGPGSGMFMKYLLLYPTIPAPSYPHDRHHSCWISKKVDNIYIYIPWRVLMVFSSKEGEISHGSPWLSAMTIHHDYPQKEDVVFDICFEWFSCESVVTQKPWCHIYHLGAFLKWGYPQLSSIYIMGLSITKTIQRAWDSPMTSWKPPHFFHEITMGFVHDSAGPKFPAGWEGRERAQRECSTTVARSLREQDATKGAILQGFHSHGQWMVNVWLICGIYIYIC